MKALEIVVAIVRAVAGAALLIALLVAFMHRSAPYTLVIVAPLAPLVAIEFDSEAKCIEAGHAIRDTYTAAGRSGQLNCYAR